MHEVARVFDRLSDDASLVRVMSLSGFGSRTAGEAAVIDGHGEVLVGTLLAGLADDAFKNAPRAGVLTVSVSDPAADAAGMACGGQARLLVQPIHSIPHLAWEALRDETPLVFTTDVLTGASRVRTDDAVAGSVGDLDIASDTTATALLRSGRSVHEVGDRLFVESFIPPTTVRMVGRAGVGDALAAQAELLGWRHYTVDNADDAVAAAEALRAHDALVVFSHDETIDTPCLAAALTHRRGYVGALGSRGTQAARRERLARLGFDEEAVRMIHGPVGLDLGSRTPAETAVAIVAEIIAHRSGRSATSLASTDGPING